MITCHLCFFMVALWTTLYLQYCVKFMCVFPHFNDKNGNKTDATTFSLVTRSNRFSYRSSPLQANRVTQRDYLVAIGFVNRHRGLFNVPQRSYILSNTNRLTWQRGNYHSMFVLVMQSQNFLHFKVCIIAK